MEEILISVEGRSVYEAMKRQTELKEQAVPRDLPGPEEGDWTGVKYKHRIDPGVWR